MKYNTVIIGAGIAGMSAAIYLKRAGINIAIFESSVPGGQLLRTSTVENYPGITRTDGATIAINLVNQLNSLDVKINYDAISEIKQKDGEFIVTSANTEVTASNIIIATGRNYKQLSVLNENKFSGHGVSYCAVCDGVLYKNEEVAVVGAGDSAFEEALYLSKICSKVTIIARNDEYRAKKELQDRVNSTENIEILNNKIVKKFDGNDNLENITIVDVLTKEESVLSKKACFIYIGQLPSTDIFKNLNLDKKDSYIVTNDKCKTNVEGIYAIGDCRKKEIYQLISAANDALVAANQIIRKK